LAKDPFFPIPDELAEAGSDPKLVKPAGGLVRCLLRGAIQTVNVRAGYRVMVGTTGERCLFLATMAYGTQNSTNHQESFKSKIESLPEDETSSEIGQTRRLRKRAN